MTNRVQESDGQSSGQPRPNRPCLSLDPSLAYHSKALDVLNRLVYSVGCKSEMCARCEPDQDRVRSIQINLFISSVKL